MKPLFAAFAFIGLAAAAIFAVASCRTEQLPANQNVEAIIGDPHAIPPKYVELQNGLADEGKLRAALAKIKRHNGICDISFLRHDGENADPEYCKHIDVSLKTDRVIKSEVASNDAPDSSAANDPNVMYKVASPNPSDVAGVLGLLK
jgi:hypothetical protein